MIGRIAGALIDKRTPEILVDAQGVAYEILVTTSLWADLPAEGERVSICTHLIVREDAHQLFGFVDRKERLIFRELIRVGGVGPKVAMGILSGMPAADLMHRVRRADVAALTRIPGIGRKTAERLVVELKDRLDKLQLDTDTPFQPAGGTSIARDPLKEAEAALVALGYKPNEAARMLSGLEFGEDVDVAEQVRQALRQVMRKQR